MFAEIIQFDIDSRLFDMQKQVAFVVQREKRGLQRTTGNIRCCLVNVDRQPRDLSSATIFPTILSHTNS